MRLRRSAALAVLSVATVLPLVGGTVVARGPAPAAARAAAEHARIVAFWTPERMMKDMKKRFRKCSDRSQAGNPEVTAAADAGAPG